MSGKNVRIAAIQAEPVWNDLEGGVNKAIALIEEAAANGANVLGFPEIFIPGYPWYVAMQTEPTSSGMSIWCMKN